MNKTHNYQSSDKTKRPLKRNKGHRGSEITATGNAPPNVAIVNQSAKALTATRRITTGVGNTSNDALNHDAIRTAASVLRNDTHSIVGTEYKACQVDTIARGGFLNNPHDFVVKDSTLVDQSTNITNHGASDKASTAKELLSKHMIPGAAHDSSARDPPPQCHPGTRIKINDRIIAWFYDKIKQELILWISGPAGVGKSAIVQTFATKLASTGCLGASVFFSRPNGRDNSHAVFITIAYQLAVHIESYCAVVSELLAFDPEILNKSMEEQFKAFIVKPFVENKIGAGGKSWGILLDGLDELNKRDRQREIIKLITTFAHDHPNVPLVWVISSRPEPHITNTFKQRRLSYKFKEEYVPIDSPEACQDVERFLRSSFKVIQQDEFPHIVAKGWPKETKIMKLANAASGLFAFADVAIRFIRDPDFADPTSRLDEVIAGVDGCRAASTDDQPFAHLDALYTHILTRIPSKLWPITQRVLGTVAASMLYSEIDCVKGLSVVLGLPLSKVYAAINDLYSLLDIPLLVKVYKKQFHFHHASFVDFLRDPARSKKFHISKENAVIDFDESCLRLWLDFKGPGPRYRDRWSEYVSQFHSESNQPADVLSTFNSELLTKIFSCVLKSLRDRWSIVQQEGQKYHWDKLLELLCQIDAGTAHSSYYFHQHWFIDLWFNIWKAHRKELTSRGIAREIQLQDLRLDSLETEEGQIVVSIIISGLTLPRTLGTRFPRNECTLYFKYFQNCYPELPVLICGLPGSRYGMVIFKVIEDDCKNIPPGKIGKRIREFINDYGSATMYHVLPCSDDA
ncbi:hypothetical protein AGABI2DRAFT_123095 [Agaricus bisporus var. bisporus H97]|uniref:hypothetical protein n=1 Tax=Agaricus bisporus var. bisporus (strain H97 / ATCC MYA-4626 / FGSC 10389) TaxID=936046 RepID=UPI00029F7DE8|nr:hypothetical protein AGABI2DRAFT_123095 [Agaricus bisporus var. bisporus H97]EKV41975.1 hypothetical protein AGABI2DRAFT_123095 [Agaricus bisporus var. bisporus H97]